MATLPGHRCKHNHVHATPEGALGCRNRTDYYCSPTPGPWEINEGDGMAIAKVSMFAITAPCTADIGDLSREEKLANAKLIAAAPELLVALRGLLAHLESWKTIEVEGGWIAVAREAISKAEGK